MATYRYTNNGGASLKLNERPLYGSSRLGSLRKEEELRSLPSFDPEEPNTVQQVDLNYELTDHLGNVCAVVTGRLLDGNGGGTPKQAELISAQGYEPFGSLLPGRNYSSSSYRFGFNGQEKDDEVFGATGTSNSAEFWQYDTRTARRWNLDPVPQVGISDYAVFGLNPVLNIDPLGDKWGGTRSGRRELRRFVTQLLGEQATLAQMRLSAVSSGDTPALQAIDAKAAANTVMLNSYNQMRRSRVLYYVNDSPDLNESNGMENGVVVNQTSRRRSGRVDLFIRSGANANGDLAWGLAMGSLAENRQFSWRNTGDEAKYSQEEGTLTDGTDFLLGYTYRRFAGIDLSSSNFNADVASVVPGAQQDANAYVNSATDPNTQFNRFRKEPGAVGFSTPISQEGAQNANLKKVAGQLDFGTWGQQATQQQDWMINNGRLEGGTRR